MNYLFIFLTGLTSGGLSCLAVQGGLLAGIIANQKKSEIKKGIGDHSPRSLDYLDWAPVTFFLGGKLISHIILGFLLGAIGSAVTLSLSAKLIFQGIAALFMFATAMNLLGVHPIFRFLAFQPPASIRRMFKNKDRSSSVFAPFVLGFMTFLIPCGITQAMEVQALSVGEPLSGALIMGVFVLGTIPLFATLGIATAKLTETAYTQFTRIAALSLIIMALYNFNGVLTVLDSPLRAQSLAPKIVSLLPPYEKTTKKIDTSKDANVIEVNGVQKVNLQVLQSGYSPSRFRVKSGMPVELTVESNGVYSCATAFTFRAFNISANLRPTDKRTFTLNPTKKGSFTFSCSMGMYSGVMEVI